MEEERSLLGGIASEATLVEVRDNQLPDNHQVTVSNIASTPLVDVSALATSANQTNGTAKNLVVDLDGHIANVQAVTNQISGDEYGMITNAIIHGKTAQGAWTDVKVNPSGALTVEATLANGVPTDIENIADNTDEWALINLEDASATITYIGKQTSAGDWLVIKIDTTTGYAVSYATVANNVGTTTYATAWTNRATLTYGDYATAF